jgi:AAA ATPase-like protein
MLIGRENESAKLRTAILRKESLLICGRPASGKSALLEEVIATLPESTRSRCLVTRVAASPREIWLDFIRALANAGDSCVLSRVETETGSHLRLQPWLKNQTSLRLRGILHRATRAGEYIVVLDPPTPLPEGVYRTLQMWVWSRRTPVFLTADGYDSQHIGRASRLFWHDDLRIFLGPLDFDSAKQLLDREIVRHDLASFADDNFREFVLAESSLLPGYIIRLCELAASPAYRFDGHLKLSTLLVDFLFHSRPLVSSTGGKSRQHWTS